MSIDAIDGFQKDKGPWKVDVWPRKGGSTVVLQSDDFHHDVSLEITGDFGTWDDKMAYAQWLAGVLTVATAGKEVSR